MRKSNNMWESMAPKTRRVAIIAGCSLAAILGVTAMITGYADELLELLIGIVT